MNAAEAGPNREPPPTCRARRPAPGLGRAREGGAGREGAGAARLGQSRDQGPSGKTKPEPGQLALAEAATGAEWL